MAMSDRDYSDYKYYMNQGDSLLRSAEGYENCGYYKDAQNKYYDAMREYERAYEIAYKCGDYNSSEASRKVGHCRSKYSEMNRKAYEKGKKYGSEYAD